MPKQSPAQSEQSTPINPLLALLKRAEQLLIDIVQLLADSQKHHRPNDLWLASVLRDVLEIILTINASLARGAL